MAGTPEKMLEHLLETQIGKVEDTNNTQKTIMSSKLNKLRYFDTVPYEICEPYQLNHRVIQSTPVNSTKNT